MSFTPEVQIKVRLHRFWFSVETSGGVQTHGEILPLPAVLLAGGGLGAAAVHAAVRVVI